MESYLWGDYEIYSESRTELVVRRLVHSLGYRYRLHQRDLPGCPDLCFASSRKVVFVHGSYVQVSRTPASLSGRLGSGRRRRSAKARSRGQFG